MGDCNCGSQDGPAHRPHSMGCTVYADDAREESELEQRLEVLRTRLKRVEKDNQTVKVTVPIEIPAQNIIDLFITAKEGGINYWAESMDFFRTDVFDTKTQGRKSVDDLLMRRADGHIGQGTIRIITDMDRKRGQRYIDFDLERSGGLDDIQKAFGIMADKYPKHFADFMADDIDATTADVFVQLCCFGEVVFG